MILLLETELSLREMELKIQRSTCHRLGVGIDISQEIPEGTVVKAI